MLTLKSLYMNTIDEYNCVMVSLCPSNRLEEHLTAEENSSTTWCDIKNVIWVRDHRLKINTARFIKQRFTIIPQNDQFYGLAIKERKMTTYAQVLGLIDQLKVYIKGLSSITIHSKNTLKLLMATNNEGSKIICINLEGLCIRVEREDGSDVPTLSKSFTGDISFMRAMAEAVNARFCGLNKSSICEKVYYKDIRYNKKSGCCKCLSYIRKDISRKKQQAVAKADKEREGKLIRAGSQFKDHVKHQVQRSASNQPYNERLVKSHFYFSMMGQSYCGKL